MQFQQWCERVFEFLVEKDLKKERVFLFFWAVERQREKRKEMAEDGLMSCVPIFYALD